MGEQYILIAFSNTKAAVCGCQYLTDQHFPVFMQPILREISSGCGLSVRFPTNFLNDIALALFDSEIDRNLYSFYRIDLRNGRRLVEPLSLEEISIK